MQLKIPLQGRGLELSNSKQGCRVAALHFFIVKYTPPMAFWHRAHSDKCFSQLLISGITPVALLESESGVEILTQRVDTKNDHLYIYSLCWTWDQLYQCILGTCWFPIYDKKKTLHFFCKYHIGNHFDVLYANILTCPTREDPTPLFKATASPTPPALLLGTPLLVLLAIVPSIATNSIAVESSPSNDAVAIIVVRRGRPTFFSSCCCCCWSLFIYTLFPSAHHRFFLSFSLVFL